MLDFANNHVDAVNKLLIATAIDPKFKYYHVSGYATISYKPNDSTWDGIDFVTINDETKLVDGLIIVTFKRPYQKASITIMHNGNSSNFLSDLKLVVTKLFNDLKVPKIKWSVLIGNRAEILYDRFISKNGGRVVGLALKEDIALDGELCDVKYYEVLREDFIKSQGVPEK